MLLAGRNLAEVVKRLEDPRVRSLGSGFRVRVYSVSGFRMLGSEFIGFGVSACGLYTWTFGGSSKCSCKYPE